MKTETTRQICEDVAAEVWQHLRIHHSGADNPVVMGDLADSFGMNRRVMHDVLQHLIVHDNRPIATSCRPPMGVFVAVTRAEKDGYAEQLRGRMIGLYKRWRAFARAPMIKEFRQQFLFESQGDTMPNATAVAADPEAVLAREADALLKRIAENQRAIASIKALADGAIDAAKAQAKRDSEPVQKRLKILDERLYSLLKDNKCFFATVRSRKLLYGTVGFRISSALKTLTRWTWAKVTATLEQHRPDLLRIKKEPDKELIRKANLPPATLKALGMRLMPTDDPYYEIDEARLVG